VPEGAIVPTAHPQRNQQPPLFDFAAVSDLLIPRQEFCDRTVTLCVNHTRIIGHPVCIEHSRYERNQYIFNLAMVLDEDADFSGHMSVVKKLASMFRNLEEQNLFLSKEESHLLWAAPALDDSGELDRLPMLDDDHIETKDNLEHITEDGQLTGSGLLSRDEASLGGKVYALCEMIMEDLNNYCECMIPIGKSPQPTPHVLPANTTTDDSNTVNLKLFPTRPAPAPIHPWHVPLSTVHLPTIATSSDLTLSRIIPHINGVLSVSQIAELADTDLSLTRKAIQHLLFYGCVLILDIFQFGAIYAPTAEIGSFVEDEEQLEEAVRYVCMGTYRRLNENETSQVGKEEWGWRSAEVGIDRAKLVALYTSLKQGQPLNTWCRDHGMLLQGIDVRRFITFGIIKGFLYRVHKYIVAPSAALVGTEADIRHDEFAVEERDANGYWRDSRRPSLTDLAHRDAQLARYLDGLHCLDEICTDLQISEKKVIEKVKAGFGDMQVIHR
jgi:hypothetical protein